MNQPPLPAKPLYQVPCKSCGQHLILESAKEALEGRFFYCSEPASEKGKSCYEVALAVWDSLKPIRNAVKNDPKRKEELQLMKDGERYET